VKTLDNQEQDAIVTDTKPDSRLWAVGLLGLWSLFFAASLMPSLTLLLIREISGVFSSSSRLYSPYIVTLGCALYLFGFVTRRCEESGLDSGESRVRGFYAFVLGLLAFLDFPIGALIRLSDVIDVTDRLIILAAIPIKILAWFYLFSLILRYYLWGNAQVFALMLSSKKDKEAS